MQCDADRMANVRGLFDLHGNLIEWTHDWYGDYAVEASTDPLGVNGGADRVPRGGAWFYDAVGCRSADRYTFAPTMRTNFLGMRLALSPSGVSPEVTQGKQAEPSGE